MVPTRLLRYAIIASITLLLFLVASSNSFAVSLLWRRTLHSPTPLMPAYRAPTIGCDHGDAIEGVYFVLLHHGCSLDKHANTIGQHVDLNSSIRTTFPETARHGLYYLADSINIDALAAIRADVMVDMVECDRRLNISLDYDPDSVEVFEPIGNDFKIGHLKQIQPVKHGAPAEAGKDLGSVSIEDS